MVRIAPGPGQPAATAGGRAARSGGAAARTVSDAGAGAAGPAIFDAPRVAAATAARFFMVPPRSASPLRGRPTAGRAPIALAVTGAVLLLLGCASRVPLGPLPPVVRAESTPPPAPAPATAPAPAPTAPPPVATGLPLPAPASAPRIPQPPAASPGVAARFPEPAVTFATPAFAPGRSDFTRSDEVRAMLAGIATGAASGAATGAASGAATGARTDRALGEVRLLDVGLSRGGEPIVAISFTRPLPPVATVPPAAPPVPVAAAAGASAPAAPTPAPPAPPARRPVVLLLAGQHGDEPAGTEALLALVQRLAAGQRDRVFDRVLDRVDVVVLPLANPDGRALLQRETGEGIDLNRDHTALRSPEAQALAQFVAGVQPDVVVDFHEYPVHGPLERRFQVLPRADVMLQAATVGNLHPYVARAAEEWFRQPLVQALQGANFVSDWYFTVPADGERRVRMGGVQADVARNVFGLRHAVSLLVETRGADLGRTDLRRRVRGAMLAAESVLASTARRAADLVKLHEFVERDVVAKACQAEAVIDATTTPSEYTLTALDPATGAPKRLNVTWDSALELRVLNSRPRPCGYWLAAGSTEAVARLRRMGVEVRQLQEAGDVRGETFRELGRAAAPDAGADGGVVSPRVRVQTQPVLVDVPAGSYYVPLDQPLANLAIAVLEPESPVGWVGGGIVATVNDVARVLTPPAARMAPAP